MASGCSIEMRKASEYGVLKLGILAELGCGLNGAVSDENAEYSLLGELTQDRETNFNCNLILASKKTEVGHFFVRI